MADPIPPNAILSANQISVAFGSNPLLDQATLAILQGERVGLVGRNGCGKSTFLKIAAGAIAPDAGQITQQRGMLTGYLPQEFELEEDATVHDAVMHGAAAVQSLLREYEQTPAESNQAATLLERIEQLDGWTLESRSKSLLTNLHAPAPDRIVRNLSGGEKRRVALCRALIARPDLLVLDEPTNHLDTESIQWLEDFLARYQGTCLFVTHDRYFLDRVSNRIVEIAQGNFYSFPGNYTDFLIAQAEREAIAEQAEHRRQKFLKSELEWVRRAPSARRTKSVDRVERYFEIAGQKPQERQGDAEIILPPAPSLGNRVISLKNVSYEIGGRTLISNFTLDIPAKTRIGIVGRNGIGKSTFLKLITGEIEPTGGTIERGPRTQINQIDQHRMQIDPNKTIWDEVGEGRETVKLGTEEVSLRGYLRRFLFTEERITQNIAQLSGGERSRVILAKILKRGGNVLLLDEPTNDLDLATLRMLEEALVQFEGTLIVVSHDRYFLNRICTHILAFEGDGKVVFDAGNYEDYLSHKDKRDALLRQKEAAFAPVAKAAPQVAKTNRTTKLSYKEERELEGMEEKILETEAEIERIESLFASPDFYAKHGHEALELQASMEAKKLEVPLLYSRWEELEQRRAGSK
ncbi:MAG: ABC-F family ATP-binding cassette domain-containing protein [Verrucomicrobiota bacterium]